jgi:hypothetical protein
VWFLSDKFASGAGQITFENDEDNDQPTSDRLGDVDPLLIPVLDPFVAVSCVFMTSTNHDGNVITSVQPIIQSLLIPR